MATTYLDRIIAAHRAAAAEDRRDADALREAACACPPPRVFGSALERAGGVAVIAEVKRASPSKGPLAPQLDPAALARDYQVGGAACISVLTDVEFFDGSPEDLGAARDAVEVPVLRKDFTVGRHDLYDARLMGADAVLLIVAALSPTLLLDLTAEAAAIGLDALVEVHDEEEAAVAVDAGARILGVNQRDLFSFAVDTERAVRVAAALPAGIVTVAESGIRGPGDVAVLADAGFDAVLVGESLVRSSDPAGAVAALRRVRRAAGAAR